MTQVLPRIEIFRPGSFTSAEGLALTFSAEDVAEIAATYDFAVNPAPIVVGHPKTDDPAWGWAGKLAFEGNVLVADPVEVEPSFAELVHAGRYKRISAQFYPRDHPGNPTPGKLHLKHIGFLGAAAPAVKGLRPVSFSDAQQAGCITIETTMQEISMSEKKSTEQQEASFAERTAGLDERERGIKAREDAAEKAERDAQHASNVSFVEARVDAGQLAPTGKGLVVGLLDALDSVTPISFGEADGELTPNAALRKLLESGGKLISFEEQAKDDGKKPSTEPHVIAAAAASFVEAEKKAGRTISIAAAVRHVQRVGVAS